jgi:hypothetical protein
MSSNSGFGVNDKGVRDFADSLEKADSLADVAPAALVAPVWRALLVAGAVDTPARVDAQRVEVLLTGPNQLELRVPVRTRRAEYVKVVPVWVGKWLARGALHEQVRAEARLLAGALERADGNPVFEHSPGPGQKPHN